MIECCICYTEVDASESVRCCNNHATCGNCYIQLTSEKCPLCRDVMVLPRTMALINNVINDISDDIAYIAIQNEREKYRRRRMERR